MRPVVIHTAAAYPQAQTIIFREFGQCFTFLLMVDIIIIAISEFEEADIAIFAFRIMFDTFQASEQQRLAHAIQICAQRIHQHHTVRNRVSGKIVIVGRACQRVIQDLVETATAKLFGNQVLQFITAVSRSLIAQIRLYIVTEFHIIISVNTENILDHVDIALYINTIYRHINHQTFGSFGNDLHFQAFQNALDRFNRNHLADQCIDLIVSQFHTIGGNRNRINILDSTRNRSACHFLNQQSGTLHHFDRLIRIQAAFITERSIRIQTEATGCLTDPSRMESGRFQEYILSLFRHTGIESAKYTGDTHRLFHIANHQITVGQRTFHTIERHKLGTFRRRAYHDFITFDLIGIERVQRLSYAVQDIVRNIHHVINGTQADHLQTVLQPFRTFLYSYIFNRNT